MVEATALQEIVDNNVCIGYRLKDKSGNIMDVACDKIIAAINANQIVFDNLYVVNNQLVFTDDMRILQAIKDGTVNTLSIVKDFVDNVNIIQAPKDGSTNNLNIVKISSGKLVVKNENVVSTKNYEDSLENKDSNSKSPELERMEYLVDLLNKAREVYEQGEDEIMSNFEYDSYYDELLELESRTGTTLDNSPTQNVGYEVNGKLPKEPHSHPMLSLDKTKDIQTLPAWLRGQYGILSWKMDGLTVVLTYDNGALTKAVTRGNGSIGELVTNNAKKFINVPRYIEYKEHLEIRGEAVITYKDFEKINVLNYGKYKNPRNLASGSVRQLDSAVTATRNVRWYAFSIVDHGKASFDNNLDSQLNWLRLLGFETVEYSIVMPNNIIDIVNDYSEKAKTFGIPVDGLVLTYRDIEYGKSLGTTAKFPNHSIAIKWEDEEKETELIRIEWQVGRTGIITPVAIFKPIIIDGTEVSRASLHNLSIMYEKLGQYPFEGQHIWVYKANMIIPQISRAEIPNIEE